MSEGFLDAYRVAAVAGRGRGPRNGTRSEGSGQANRGTGPPAWTPISARRACRPAAGMVPNSPSAGPSGMRG
ncbi:hypothetical protein FDZ84_11565 [Saccharopolyspora sp. ASAGF58]|nr:hypothetical protein FDZ84_11565 [Saccharopolyspora sp. ASAGF58]